jgi:hypothetical protein
MGKEGNENDNTFTYANQGESVYFNIYDSSAGSILDLSPNSDLPGWELNEVFIIQGTSTGIHMEAYPTYQNCINLYAGANLLSFYVLPDDKSVTNMLSSLGDNATGIIGEGVAASKINGNWTGSLTTIDKTSGYWVIISEAVELCIFGEPVIGSEVEYNLHSGANLVSSPYANSNEIESALTEDTQANLTGIIGEGVAASQINGEWNGSLDAFAKNQ